MNDDGLCKHDMLPGTCTDCKGATASGSKSGKGGSSSSQRLDTPESVETYRDRYPEDREPTFEAYVQVFFPRPERRTDLPRWVDGLLPVRER